MRCAGLGVAAAQSHQRDWSWSWSWSWSWPCWPLHKPALGERWDCIAAEEGRPSISYCRLRSASSTSPFHSLNVRVCVLLPGYVLCPRPSLSIPWNTRSQVHALRPSHSQPSYIGYALVSPASSDPRHTASSRVQHPALPPCPPLAPSQPQPPTRKPLPPPLQAHHQHLLSQGARASPAP